MMLPRHLDTPHLDGECAVPGGYGESAFFGNSSTPRAER
jgi:hypothetical protein